MSIWLRPIAIGFGSALLLKGGTWISGVAFPIVWVGVLLVFAVSLWQRWLGKRNLNYQGVSDLILHVHQAPPRDFGQKWGLRAVITFLVSSLTGKLGPEGYLIEANQEFLASTRPTASSWFEQQRRTDVACALAAGLAATFYAPFAAVVIGMELRVGGHTLSAVVSAVVAMLSSRLLGADLWFPAGVFLSGVETLSDPKSYLMLLRVIFVMSFFSLIYFGFVILARRVFADLRQRNPWFSWIAIGFLVSIVMLAFVPANQSFLQIWPQLLEGKIFPEESVYLLIALGLTTGILQGGLGSTGFFLPTLVLGGLAVSATLSLQDPLWLLVAGGAALGASMGIPLTAALLVAEWSRHPWVLVWTWIAAVCVLKVLGTLKRQNLVEEDLTRRGLVLEMGRSKDVLESLKVKDVMVEDGPVLAEDLPLAEVAMQLKDARYPFVTIINRRGEYLGIVATAVIEEAARHETDMKLLEAKDLLVRQKIKVKPFWVDEHLGATTGVFDRSPVIPVIDRKKKPVGLLFSHHVRIAYDREIERRSIEVS